MPYSTPIYNVHGEGHSVNGRVVQKRLSLLANLVQKRSGMERRSACGGFVERRHDFGRVSFQLDQLLPHQFHFLEAVELAEFLDDHAVADAALPLRENI